MAAVPILRKICNPFPLFLFINTPLSNDQMKTFIYSLFVKTTSLPRNLLLINHIFSWKSKLKHTGVDISKMQNLHQQNIKRLEASYGTSETFKLELFTKKVNGLLPKTISAKNTILGV